MRIPKPWDDVVPQTDIDSFNTGREEIDRPLRAGDRPALIVVDMTWEFVDSRYPLGHGATGWPCVEANATLLAAARDRGIPVYFTNGFADPSYRPEPKEVGPWRCPPTWSADDRDLPVGDCIVDALTPAPSEVVIHKGGRPSAFFGTDLVSMLISERIDTLMVTGMVTSGCVRATVLDAFQYNYRAVVPYECVADRSAISHAVSLFDMHMKYADVVSLDETLSYLQSLSSDGEE